MRKAKRILAFALSLVVVFSGINYAAITSNEVAAATVSTTEWTNNGLISPANGSLIGAGYIDVKWNNNLEGVSSYAVYVDNALIGTVSPTSAETLSCEFYTVDVSAHTAKVRTIINDTSMVSAMFLKTNDSCIVNGSLDTMEDGYLEVVYISKDAKVKNGDELVTSYVSSKFNEGITIGKVSDIKLDSTKLTKTAKVTPIVDFKHLKEVLVITDLKKTENLDTGTKE